MAKVTPDPLPPWALQTVIKGPVPSRADRMLEYGMTSSEDIQKMQRHENARAARALRRSEVSSLTLDVAVEDAKNALTGILTDLAGGGPRKSIPDVFLHHDRLRGLGVLCMTLAVTGIIIDFIMAG